MSTMITINTTELQAGDVVLTHGMRVLVDGPIESRDGVVWTKGQVLNLEAVAEAGIVPTSWLYEEIWTEGGWKLDRDAAPRWQVQGNDLATWLVERA